MCTTLKRAQSRVAKVFGLVEKTTTIERSAVIEHNTIPVNSWKVVKLLMNEHSGTGFLIVGSAISIETVAVEFSKCESPLSKVGNEKQTRAFVH